MDDEGLVYAEILKTSVGKEIDVHLSNGNVVDGIVESVGIGFVSIQCERRGYSSTAFVAFRNICAVIIYQ